jgi:hypothetical protein
VSTNLDKLGNLIDVDRFGLAFDANHSKIIQPNRMFDTACGISRQQDRAGRRRRLQPGRKIHRIANGEILDVQIVADVANDYLAGVDADPHLEIGHPRPQGLRIGVNRFLDIERGPHGPQRIIFVRDRGTKKGEDAIPEQLGNGAFIVVYRLANAPVGAADDLAPVFGVVLFGECC